ncbi:argininosuccinate lyase [Bryobacterales bacterium F-183]|nr:argininosuccinate lyase [Bryobacterales bacterium F-183]
MKKLWGGRFSETADESLDNFWNSIAFDNRLARQDIRGSMAHAAMLAKQGIIPQADADAIRAGLEGILKDVEDGSIEFALTDEDIHMNVERILHERIGASAAGKLHTARSRNDQVATDMHLFVRDEACKETIALLHGLQTALREKAAEYANVIMPGYTHLQRAQPVLFGHHLLVYVWMLQRDIGRLMDCYKRANLSPLGAGAIAGTTFPIDREATAQELGFSGIYPNSMDAVSDRDFVIETLFCNALIAGHLSRFCEEVILWMSNEFGFVGLSDKYCTGSSMMPQKKNADLAELVRGKTGRVYGALFAMLTVLKGVPLTYNKDFQEDKEGLFDSVDTVQKSVFHLTGMVKGMVVKPDVTRKAASAGFLNATDVADYLAKRSVPFREAHEVTGKLVAYCLKNGKELDQLTLEELRGFHASFENDVYADMDLDNVVNRRNSAGGTALPQVQKQLEQAGAALSETAAWLAAH